MNQRSNIQANVKLATLRSRCPGQWLVAAVFIAVAFSCLATDYTWNGGSGDWSVAGNWTPAGGPPSATDTATINSGTASVSATTDVGTLNFGGGTLIGTGTLTVNNAMTWTGGDMEEGVHVVIAPTATLNITNTAAVTMRHSPTILENAGTVNFMANGMFTCQTGAVVTNRPGALWQMLGNQALSYGGAPESRFDNAGIFRKSTGTGTTAVYFLFNNYASGTVEVQSGRLSPLYGGSSSSGTFSVDRGAAVIFASNFTLNSGATLNGDGQYTNQGNLTVNASASVRNFTHAGGVLTGTGTLTVSNVMTWTGGDMEEGVHVVIAPTATLNITNTAAVTMRHSPTILENAGTVNFMANGMFTCQTGAVVTNRPGALWQMLGNQALSYGGAPESRFDNAGIFRKSTSTGTTGVDFPFNNYGTIDIRSGILAMNGGFGSSSAATLVSSLAGTNAGTGFGQLQISGGVTLNGSLSVDLVNGFYPATNDMFTVLTAGTRSGTFSNFYYPSNDVGMAVTNTSSSVFVQVINVRPTIPLIGSQTNHELVLFSLNVNATDDDSPPQALTYALANSPEGTAIDPSGQVTWTPTEEQGPLATNITVLVTDDGMPNLTASRTFSIFINESNQPPVLTLPTDIVTTELVALGLTASATDADIPANPLRFDLVSGPQGLTVSSTGDINWTPTEAQGSNDYVVAISVTDTNADAVNAKELSVTNTFTITANEVNESPTIIVPADQTVLEETAVTLTNLVNDPDVPANSFTFELLSAPAGMTINAGNGVISWIPNETQGSNSFTVTVRVTDFNPLAINATQLSDTNSFTVTVNESNRPPVLLDQTAQTLDELTTLTLTNSATDPDQPANPLAYELINAPTGAVISVEGVITWTPSEAQGPSTNLFITVVTDTNALAAIEKNLSTTNAFTVVVNEVNVAPVLTVPPSSTNDELLAYSATVTATDSDMPANTLTFELLSGPSGLTVNSAGAINWTPTEAQGPGAYPVSVRVFDNSTPSLSHTQNFTLTVNEVNVAPQLDPLGDYVVNPGQTISFNAPATDADLPTNTLTFSLVNPPTGAAIDALSGAFAWRIPVSLAALTNSVSVRVVDDGAPPLSAVRSFDVIVHPLVPVVLTPISFDTDEFQLCVTGFVGPDYVFQRSSELSDWISFLTNTPTSLPFNVTDTNEVHREQFYRVLLRP